jgi:Protein of unknown function C-terminus (DUF2399)
LWRRFGVVVDDVSSDVLVLNVRPAGSGWVRSARHLVAVGSRGRRAVSRDIASTGIGSTRTSGGSGSVFENPAVVMEAAERLGANSSPLVCTDGVPTDAGRFTCCGEPSTS